MGPLDVCGTRDGGPATPPSRGAWILILYLHQTRIRRMAQFLVAWLSLRNK